MLDVLHILPSCHDRDAGLPVAVKDLAAAQIASGLRVEIEPADKARFGRRSSVLRAIAGAKQPRLLQSHGLWLSPSHVSRRWRSNGHMTLVAPHGMLDPWTWKRHRLLKTLRWKLGESETLAKANCLQALCTAEASLMRDLGLNNPIAIIPNGISPPDRSQQLPSPPWQGKVPEGAQILLFLGRFNRKKGILPLLKAWSLLQESFSDLDARKSWWLVFVGFDDGVDLTRQLRYHQIPRCLIVGPAFGETKKSAYANASGFILPSFSEGLPLAALEAMSWGVPCMLSEKCNLPSAFQVGAAMLADPDHHILFEQLLTFIHSSPNHHATMAAAGQALVLEQFSWRHVAAQHRILYNWICYSGEKPDFLYPI